MRRLAFPLVVAAVALMVSACGGAGYPDAASTKTITIGIKFDQPGLGQQIGDEVAGFDVDMATYVARQLGYTADEIEWVEAPSSQRENLLANRQVDMILATYSITDERAEKVTFAGPYYVAGQDLLVRSDSTSITGPGSLSGKKLCSVTGSTPAQRIKDEYAHGVQLQEYDTYSKCVEALTNGTVDAMTTDDIILAGYAAQEQYEGQLKIVGKPFSEERYGVGLPKGSDQCVAVNAAIKKMIDSGEWKKALEKNMGANFTPDPKLDPPTTFETCP